MEVAVEPDPLRLYTVMMMARFAQVILVLLVLALLLDILEPASAQSNRNKKRRKPRLRTGRRGDVQEGDVVWTAEQYKILQELRKKNKTTGRDPQAASYRYIQKWTNGKVYYYYSSSFSSSDRYTIRNAMNKVQSDTGNCISFNYSTTAANRVRFQAGYSGCWANFGMVGGVQYINLQRSGCVHHGVILHELMHTLGLIHEQNRPDRDNHVTINFQNIDSTKYRQFYKQPVWVYTVAYDYRSIMHYGRRAFSINGRDTITTTNSAYQSVIGQRSYLSTGDVAVIKHLYSCP